MSEYKYRSPLENWPSGHIGWYLSDELKPCSSCGGRPEYSKVGNDRSKRQSVTVRCGNCRIKRTDATLHQGFDWVIPVAFKNWNERAVSDELERIRNYVNHEGAEYGRDSEAYKFARRVLNMIDAEDEVRRINAESD